MNTAAASWNVGKFRVTLAASVPREDATLTVTVTWEPEPEKLTKDEMRLYRRGRERAIRELAKVLGPFVTLTH